MSDTTNITVSERGTYSAFFYGTLLHPKVLKRVIRNTGAHLKISPAILEGYVRHKVLWADFPAIISSTQSHETFQTEPTEEGDRVRGSYVSGLTAMDIFFLDRFESGLYAREMVDVCLLAEPVDLDDVDLGALIQVSPENITKMRTTYALTYVWSKPLSQLKAEPWSFAEFVHTKLDNWA
ncbi:hypothetical protein M408DRAFT_326310 [Serendipita vermifera MAFF 305830]|uniref:Putative gamma-glutamylcyclotransferase n=1 Tax=Serendipita vermifera MAFF 305830 TaxID=933852 RepID=A0A0C3BQF4_SERVB|nr:hypothetical protein M408DRAFT_326310 [Serendipita vermifera MAFF 305830]